MLLPNEEIYLNLGHDEDDKIMVRLISIELETRMNPKAKEAIISEIPPIDINNLVSSKHSNSDIHQPGETPP